mmetsp:Transcript_54223/g.118700  ORF Transcript_54223/g.118700 Transcript_54223/m.118700 type:complete len:200 (+) Transcript_54223:278-877(+)
MYRSLVKHFVGDPISNAGSKALVQQCRLDVTFFSFQLYAEVRQGRHLDQRVKAHLTDGRLLCGILGQTDSPEAPGIAHGETRAIGHLKFHLAELGGPSSRIILLKSHILQALFAFHMEAACHAQVKHRRWPLVHLEPKLLSPALALLHRTALQGDQARRWNLTNNSILRHLHSCNPLSTEGLLRQPPGELHFRQLRHSC